MNSVDIKKFFDSATVLQRQEPPDHTVVPEVLGRGDGARAGRCRALKRAGANGGDVYNDRRTCCCTTEPHYHLQTAQPGSNLPRWYRRTFVYLAIFRAFIGEWTYRKVEILHTSSERA